MLLLAVPGCGSEEKDPECVDPPAAEKAPAVERFGLGKAGAKELKDHDWCRACVMSKVGFASCQRVYSDEPGTLPDRAPLRAKAREKACDDAGFKKGECPDGAVINLLCKDDKLPEGTKTPGEAVQDLFKSLNPAAPTGGASGANPATAPGETAEGGEKPASAIIE
jgi:hypothetical protein